MNLNKSNINFFLKVICDFKKTQPKKKRQNIDRAFRKITRNEPLNRLEKEAHIEFGKFISTYDSEK